MSSMPVRHSRQLPLPVSTSPLRGPILILADALFDGNVPAPALANRGFSERFGMDSHGLDDLALLRLIGEYVERGLLRVCGRADELLGRPDVIGLTAAGGAAWEAARRPDWSCYVDTVMRETDRGWRLEVRSPSKEAAQSYIDASEAAPLHVARGKIRWRRAERAPLTPWRRASMWIGVVSCTLPADPPQWPRFQRRFDGWRTLPELLARNRKPRRG